MAPKRKYHIIAIDDNVVLLQTLKIVLGSVFEKVGVISDPRLILGVLAGGDVDAVLLDMNFDSVKLDGSEGLYWLQRIKSVDNPPAVIMMTAFGGVDIAVESMKNEADDFICKPWDNAVLIDKIIDVVERRSAQAAKHSDIKRSLVSDSSDEHVALDSLASAERKQIALVLNECRGNMSKAADLLGISRRTLYNKKQKYGL